MGAGADEELVGLLRDRAIDGQAVLASALRTYLRVNAPGVLAGLGAGPGADDRLLEPLGFASVSGGVTDEAALRVVYAGAMPVESRPEALQIDTDDRGRAFLPGSGYLVGLPPSRQVTVHRDHSEVGYDAGMGTPVPIASLLLRAGGPALLPYPVPALERAGGTHHEGLAGVERAASDLRHALRAGLDRIDDIWPELSRLLGLVTRDIVLFDDPAENSFAKTSAHGVAFLNVALGDTTAFFVEDLPHQCGHLVFTAAWEAADPLLSIPSDTTVGTLVGSPDERSIEVAMHGMVTQTLMVAALGRALTVATDAREHNELTGRLVFALMRLGLDLRQLAPQSIYTDAGATLMRSLLGCYAAAAGEHGERLMRTSFEGQPYNFDWAEYERHNLALLVS